MTRRTLALLLMSLASPWLRSNAAGASNAATPTPAADNGKETPGEIPVSLTVRNLGGKDDRLLAASSPLAEHVLLHVSRLVTGVRQMLPAAAGIDIPAGATVGMEPGLAHVMLVGLRQDLVQGESFPLTLRFAQAGEVTITVRVRRKLDAAGVSPLPPVRAGDIEISLAAAPPAPASVAATPGV